MAPNPLTCCITEGKRFEQASAMLQHGKSICEEDKEQ